MAVAGKADQPIVWPPPWRSGMAVGILSTSSATLYRLPRRTERAVQALESALAASHVYIPARQASSGFVVDQPSVVADNLHRMIANPQIGLIISAIGGFNTNAILEHLDWELLRANPRLICGYSDMSCLLNAVVTKSGVCTFHGPALLPQWGDPQGPFEEAKRAVLAMFAATGRAIELKYPGRWCDPRTEWSNEGASSHDKMTQDQPWRALVRGVGKGRLVGGNVETLNMLIGTPYQPDFAGAILFVEATGAEAHLPRLARALTHLRASGSLAQINGLIVGRCPDAHPVDCVTLDDVILQSLAGTDVPVAVDVDLGHTEPMITLPLGADATLDTSSTEVVIRVAVPVRGI